MSTSQGTAWETKIVRDARDDGFPADRLPKRGVKGEPDVWINAHPFAGPTTAVIPVLAWKRLTKTKPDAKRRTPDGEAEVFVMSAGAFHDILYFLPDDYSVVVQAKATQTLNVTRVLGDLIKGLTRMFGE